MSTNISIIKRKMREDISTLIDSETLVQGFEQIGYSGICDMVDDYIQKIREITFIEAEKYERRAEMEGYRACMKDVFEITTRWDNNGND